MKNAIIIKGIAPMMVQPAPESGLADEALHGMEVEVLSERVDKWVEVQTNYRYQGFVEEKYLCRDEDCIRQYREAKKFRISSYTADVLSEPKVQSQILLCLPKGALVIKTDYSQDNWCGVITADGRKGYIREKLLSEYIDTYDLSKEGELRESLVNTALSYMKSQYRWGGKTPLGIDCSGLTSISYLLNGVKIYRDADIRDGFAMVPIPNLSFDKNGEYLSKVKPGDLIFFPGHVAMYIGSGRYIHSSPINEGVGINSLDPLDECYHAELAGKITKIGTIFMNFEV